MSRQDVSSCEAVLLGRSYVDGAVNASSLAILVRSFLARSKNVRTTEESRYVLRCRERGLEVIGARPDEGFESDTESTRSGDTVEERFCGLDPIKVIDDHVFKFHDSDETSSANSSASDTDDLEGSSPTHHHQNTNHHHNQQQHQPNNSSTNNGANSTMSFREGEEGLRELYSVSDVVFCHTDSSFPRVVVWVVKTRRSSSSSSKEGATPNQSSLEAVVFECKNEESAKKLCNNYHDLSRRFKLEQYKHHRRKDSKESETVSSSTVAPSPTKDNNSHTSPSLFQNPHQNPHQSSTSSSAQTPTNHVPNVTTATSTNTAAGANVIDSNISTNNNNNNNNKTAKERLPVPRKDPTDIETTAKWNLVHRTDGDGITHIEVSGAAGPGIDACLGEDEEPSSIISISTPDVGNLLNCSVKPNKSKFNKEIEGIILTDVDTRKEPTLRQRQPAMLLHKQLPGGAGQDDSELRKVWSPPPSKTSNSSPPQRPERRRYVKKKGPAPSPPNTPAGGHPSSRNGSSNPTSSSTELKRITSNVSSSHSKESSVSARNQFVRVSVDHSLPTATVVSRVPQYAWMYVNIGDFNNNAAVVAPLYPHWLPQSDMHHSAAAAARSSPNRDSRMSQEMKRRSRSKSPTKRPMAYRYIDAVTSSRFVGLSQKLREISGSVVSSSKKGSQIVTAGMGSVSSRNSNQMTADEFGPRSISAFSDANANSGGQGNLKSVIKKTKKYGEYTEPKKVTFSAFATVQVVD